MKELKEQLQEDILSLLEGFNIGDCLSPMDYDALKDALCESVISNVNKLNQ